MRVSNAAKAAARRCAWITGPDYCPERAWYLVLVQSAAEFRPYCRRHMAQAVTFGCDQAYRAAPAGHREPVQVLPIDVR